MPHNLATTDGRTAMAFFGETPWHNLGTRLDNPATAEEAIVAAGLDYEVELSPLMTDEGIPVPQRRAVVRRDSYDVIGVVGNNYTPIQNRQCFGFLDAVVAEGSLRYHTAGALGQGERVWMLAKLPDGIRVRNSDDVVDKFLLLSNTHDGSSALRVFFTPIRVVCQNTLNLAEGRGRGQGVAVMHRGDLAAKIRESQRVLGLAQRFYDDAAERINMLAGYQPSAEQLENFFKALYPDPTHSENRRAKNIRHRLTELFDSGMGQEMPEVRHSMWAALNAVTEYVDHHRPTRGIDDSDRATRRLDSAWFGSGARLKANAWELALSVATGN
jgi:phage/plasmid-like protein (TIGR03299 family)